MTWALAGPASPRVINPAAAGTASRRAALRIFMRWSFEFVDWVGAYAASAPSPSRTGQALCGEGARGGPRLGAPERQPATGRTTWSSSLTSRARRSPTARDGWSGSSKISWSAPAITDQTSTVSPALSACAVAICQPMDSMSGPTEPEATCWWWPARWCVRLDCHRREQRVHTELRDPEAENHHRGADPTPEDGPGRGEDECTDQCDPTHGGQLAARPDVGGHRAGHDRARGEGSARGHGIVPVTRIVRYMHLPKQNVYPTVAATVPTAIPEKRFTVCMSANSNAETHGDDSLGAACVPQHLHRQTASGELLGNSDTDPGKGQHGDLRARPRRPVGPAEVPAYGCDDQHGSDPHPVTATRWAGGRGCSRSHPTRAQNTRSRSPRGRSGGPGRRRCSSRLPTHCRRRSRRRRGGR